MNFSALLAIAILLAQNIVIINSARILMLSPMGTRSHMYSFMPIMETLAERGHQVAVVTAHAPKTNLPNIHKIVVTEIVQHLENDWQNFEQISLLSVITDFITEMRTLQKVGYEILMKNSEIQEILRTKNVDLVVVDAIMNEFTLPLIDDLGVPFIFHSASTGPPWTLAAFDVAQDYASVPSLASEYKSQMTFVERFLNLALTEIFLLIRKIFSLRMLDGLTRKDFPNGRAIEEIERNAELCLASSHPATAWPRSLPPTFVPIGALHVGPPNPLPKDLQDFADGAEHGFIVFTLGSNALVSNMPERIKLMFIRVFAQIPQRVFWKWEKGTDKVSDNVKLLDWLPQQDLLGHEKARLFISHGGLLGTQETIYHGVPILGLPLGRDQMSNLVKSEEEGYGIKLEWEYLTETLLYESIQKLLHEPSYEGNVTRLSKLMHDELIPSREVAAYWVEHVLRHGGTKHLQPKNKNMPFYQLYLLDVWLLMIAILILPPLAIYKILSFNLKRRTSRKTKQQ